MKQEIKPSAVVTFMFETDSNVYDLVEVEVVVIAFDPNKGIRLEGEHDVIGCFPCYDPDSNLMNRRIIDFMVDVVVSNMERSILYLIGLLIMMK